VRVFRFFVLHTFQVVDRRVIDVLDFVDRDYCNNWPVQTDRIRHIFSEHVELDCFVASIFKGVWL